MQRLQRQHERGCGGIGPEHLCQDADERRRCGQIGRLIQRRDRKRFPQPVTELPALPVCREPLRHRAGWHRRHLSGLEQLPARTMEAAPPASWPQSDRATASRPNRGPRQAGSTVMEEQDSEGRSACRRCRGTPPPCDGCIRTFPSASMRRRKSSVSPVAAEQHMLPVVDELSGVPIDEGRGAAAELRPSVEDGDRCAAVGEQGAGAQAGETGADDDDVRARAGSRRVGHRRPTAVRAHVVAAISARCGRGMRTTRLNTS